MKVFSSLLYGFKREIYRSEDELYLTRYYILESKFLSIYIHQFHMSDYPVPHCHPWNFVAIPLKTGYIEHFPDGTSIIRKPFRPAFRTKREFHWIERIPFMPAPWTLFITFHRSRRWGFLTEKGWVDHEEYIQEMLREKK